MSFYSAKPKYSQLKMLLQSSVDDFNFILRRNASSNVYLFMLQELLQNYRNYFQRFDFRFS